ncbi:NAD-dependent epimerase/dehydratase [Aquiluna sp.]|nr:NAD-dependent epimerase/dehydratase [Aquiluna sp.]
MRVLVTGASGMLGGAVVRALMSYHSSVEIFALRHRSSIPAGVRELSRNELSPKRFDVIVHAASPASPVDHVKATNVIDANVQLTNELLATTKPNGVFVFISTGEVYGPEAGNGVGEWESIKPQMAGPRSYYPLAKVLGENLVLSQCNVRSVVLRTFHTFGPGVRRDDGRSFADFIWGAAQNKRIELKSDGSAVRSLLHVDDFARGVLAVMDSTVAHGIYNIGSSIPMSILDIAKRISTIAGADLSFSSINNPKDVSPINVLTPNVEKLESAGWRRLKGVDDIIKDTLYWISVVNPSE